jgi:hypothetical protein
MYLHFMDFHGIYPEEDGGSTNFQNIGKHLSNERMPQPKRSQSSQQLNPEVLS